MGTILGLIEVYGKVGLREFSATGLDRLGCQ
jgi:hypothetical protein